MKTSVKTSLNSAEAITKRLGIDKNGRIQQNFTAQVFNLSSKYTPWQVFGVLPKTAKVTSDMIHYTQLYSHYLWHGKLMVGKISRSAWANPDEDKEYVNPEKDLKYTGAPIRGPRWVLRMWEDRKGDILQWLERKIRSGI